MGCGQAKVATALVVVAGEPMSKTEQSASYLVGLPVSLFLPEYCLQMARPSIWIVPSLLGLCIGKCGGHMATC